MIFSYFFIFFVIILAVLDLLNNIKVQTVIGPETYLDAKLLAPVADKAKVPIFTLAGSPSMDYPYLFQIKEDESVMAETIATFVESSKWKDVVFLYEDADFGRDILSYILESFQDKSIRVIHRNDVPTLATDDEIVEELQKIMTSQTRVIIVHMSSTIASRVLILSNSLGMVSEEYNWIVTYKTIEILQLVDFEVIESLKGVICLRSYIPLSSKLLNLTERWYNEYSNKEFLIASREVIVLAIWAYDTIWALAE